ATDPSAVPPSTATPPAAAATVERSARAGAPRVALLLPLTGPNAAVGQALLDAATQAVFDVADDNFALLVRDTAGTPQGALAAFEWAVAQEARLVIGPLLGAETQAVAPAARAAGVAVLSLSNDRTVAAPGVFTLGIAPQDAVARTVEYARARGLERFAALVPNNALGVASERALRTSLAASGGELVRIERYDAGALDFAPSVRRLGQLAGPPPRLARGEIGPPPPELDFDAVLLPDFGDRLIQVVAQLHGHEIDPARVKYLGIPLWDDPRTLRESSLQGAWFANTAQAPRAAFEERFRGSFGRPAPRVASLAYDAVALAAILARDKGPDGADFSLEALTTPAGFAGVDGIFRLATGGTVERGFAILEVRREGARVLAPAPETFEAPSN
ncbi:MAG: penicillin-binding protein activator, partial [Rhodospirillales bacterium]|nr:penicillin-binding protein activator [Rhodospirillales bacterium]